MSTHAIGRHRGGGSSALCHRTRLGIVHTEEKLDHE
jgi:hypothetical protein